MKTKWQASMIYFIIFWLSSNNYDFVFGPVHMSKTRSAISRSPRYRNTLHVCSPCLFSQRTTSEVNGCRNCSGKKVCVGLTELENKSHQKLGAKVNFPQFTLEPLQLFGTRQWNYFVHRATLSRGWVQGTQPLAINKYYKPASAINVDNQYW